MTEINETPEVQEEAAAPKRSKGTLRWVAFTLLMLAIAALTTSTVLAGDGKASEKSGCCFSSLFHCSSSAAKCSHPDAVQK